MRSSYNTKFKHVWNKQLIPSKTWSWIYQPYIFSTGILVGQMGEKHLGIL